jgi:hypothetical protein
MDPEFNSKERVLNNMKHNFKIAAIKMEMIVFKTRRGIFGYVNEHFIFSKS